MPHLPRLDPHPILRANARVLGRIDAQHGDWRALMQAVRQEGLSSSSEARASLICRGLRPTEAELVGCLAFDEAWEFVDEAAYLRWAEEQALNLFSQRSEEALRSFLELVAEVRKLGSDVSVSPLKTHVPFLRGDRVFAKVVPARDGRLRVTVFPDWRTAADTARSLARAFRAVGARAEASPSTKRPHPGRAGAPRRRR